MKFRLVEENELEKRAKYHRKRQKGMSPFYSPDGGNVPLAIDRFNSSVADGANGLCESSLNESNYEGSYGFVSLDAYKKIKQLSKKLTNILNEYDKVLDSIESKAQTDEDRNALEVNQTYRTLIKTYQDNYEVINLLSDMIKDGLIQVVDDDFKEDILIDLGIYTVSDLQNMYNRLEKTLADTALSESLKEDTVKNNKDLDTSEFLSMSENEKISYYINYFKDAADNNIKMSKKEKDRNFRRLSKICLGINNQSDYSKANQLINIAEANNFILKGDVSKLVNNLRAGRKFNIKKSNINEKFNFNPLKEDTVSSKEKEIFNFLDELGGYTDYNGRIEEVASEFNLSKDEAENVVWNWTLYSDDFSEGLNEDTVKNSDGTWSNKGDEGSHGKFKTKKKADAQRKAMFANGYKEDWNIKYYNDLDSEFGYDPGPGTLLVDNPRAYPMDKSTAKSIARNLSKNAPDFMSYWAEEDTDEKDMYESLDNDVTWEKWYDDAEYLHYSLKNAGGRADIIFKDNDGDSYWNLRIWPNRNNYKYRTYILHTDLDSVKKKAEDILQKYNKESLAEARLNPLKLSVMKALDFLDEYSFPFPGDDLLADNWHNAKEGIEMGIDPLEETAEFLISYMSDLFDDIDPDLYNEAKDRYEDILEYSGKGVSITDESLKESGGNDRINRYRDYVSRNVSSFINNKFNLKNTRSKYRSKSIKDKNDKESIIKAMKKNGVNDDQIKSIINSLTNESLQEAWFRPLSEVSSFTGWMDDDKVIDEEERFNSKLERVLKTPRDEIQVLIDEDFQYDPRSYDLDGLQEFQEVRTKNIHARKFMLNGIEFVFEDASSTSSPRLYFKSEEDGEEYTNFLDHYYDDIDEEQ